MFSLKNYVSDIRNIATKHGVPEEKAVSMFVLNLNVMREQFSGASSSVNYHTLGQEWSKLPSGQRLQQKKEVLRELSKSASRNNSMMK